VAVEACPCSLPWGGLGLALDDVLGSVMFVPYLARDPLADGAEYRIFAARGPPGPGAAGGAVATRTGGVIQVCGTDSE
jgi:hypothetical protein